MQNTMKVFGFLKNYILIIDQVEFSMFTPSFWLNDKKEGHSVPSAGRGHSAVVREIEDRSAPRFKGSGPDACISLCHQPWAGGMNFPCLSSLLCATAEACRGSLFTVITLAHNGPPLVRKGVRWGAKCTAEPFQCRCAARGVC